LVNKEDGRNKEMMMNNTVREISDQIEELEIKEV